MQQQQQQEQEQEQHHQHGDQPVIMSTTGDDHDHDHQRIAGDPGLLIAEAASPISSRPPATNVTNINNFDELMRVTEVAAAGGSSSSSINRWPRQETLALLQVRSDMDAAFRDATLKTPLWEQVSRKLGELGYTRSGKKCKEKFENVQKYHKRTKEGRGGRQDGKSYKFFNQLEALHHTMSNSPSVQPASSSGQHFHTTTSTNINPGPTPGVASIVPPPPLYGADIGINFSSDSSSSSEDDDDMEEDTDMEMESIDHHNRKRKRSTGTSTRGGDDDDMKMMEFFDGLMKEVMQKQEAMQQKFLEAIDKREQDRMIREEAWKRQDMARLARQHDLMAQDRAITSARDAAIIDFLQKITGQSIHLPTHAPPPAPVSIPSASRPHQQQQQPVSIPQQHDHQKENPVNPVSYPPQPQGVEVAAAQNIVTAVPEQQIVPHQDFTSLDATPSSRWPKAEVLALIQLRSGMDTKYLEAGPKGPLWEEISAAMERMGYNRSAKRCKEKWENINKYYKKVKESNKKRPEDAKTCPYFHELDALYRKKVLGNTSTSTNVVVGSSTGILGSSTEQPSKVNESEVKDTNQTSNVGEQSREGATGEGAKQPEDRLMTQNQQSHGNMIDECNIADLDLANDDHDDYEDIDENEEEMKMDYKIQFQRQNVGSSGGSGTASSTSFMAMVK